MAMVSPEFIERYQIELAKNPSSRIFAPLAEAYRQMGLIDEGYRICTKGVQIHPDFAGGRVAFAKILMEKKDWENALSQLERAAQLSPDNLLAQSLLGETLLELRRPKDALKAFKMVLFLNPKDERALKAVAKWEFLSADEYDDELFAGRPTFQNRPQNIPQSAAKIVAGARSQGSEVSSDASLPAWQRKQVERAVSLADAFTVRGELDKAMRVLSDAREQLGALPDLDRRFQLLSKRSREATASSTTEQRRGRLERLLARINERRLD